jgi:hypothetical protein
MLKTNKLVVGAIGFEPMRSPISNNLERITTA